MGKEEVEKIKREFSSLKLHPEYLKHKEVITSEDAAKTRGFELKQGIKAILFTNNSDWVITNIPADKKVDEKKEEALKEKQEETKKAIEKVPAAHELTKESGLAEERNISQKKEKVIPKN